MKLHRHRAPGKRRNRVFGSLESRLSKRSAPFQYETLENRSLLAGDTTSIWHNAARPADVNGDGRVQALDALIVINDIDRYGMRAVRLASDAPTLQAMAMTSSSGQGGSQKYVDVSGDNRVSALDVLLVANALVDDDDEVHVRLVATDLAGNPITSVAPNTDFRIEVYARDIRELPTGIFGIYIDADITGGAVEANGHPIFNDSIDPNGENDFYTSGQRFNFSDTDNIKDVGSFSPLIDPDSRPPADEEVRIYTFTVRAGSSGSVTVTPKYATTEDILVYEQDTAVPQDRVGFDGVTIPITAASTLPAVTVTGPATAINELTGATANAVFTISIAGAVTQNAVVNFETFAGTAQSSGTSTTRDYTALVSAVTFTPGGPTSQTVTVAVNGDNLSNEGTELFHLDLMGVTNAVAGDSHATATIVDDDGVPVLITVSDPVVTEGNPSSPATTTPVTFTLTLDKPTQSEVTVAYATEAVTATGGTSSTTANADFVNATGVATFAANARTTTVTIQVVKDTVDEDNETFRLNLSNIIGATIDDTQGTATITDDEGVNTPSISISDAAAVAEGNSGTANSVFTVTLSSAATGQVLVPYSTGGGTATAGTDYTTNTNTLTFAAGETSKQITVLVTGDTNIEATETFNVTLGTPTGATVSDGTGVGTITNDDNASLTISNLTVVEGNSGTTNAVLTVTLSQASSSQVTVQYATGGGTATAGTDYTTSSGTITFAAGTTSQLITIPIVGDTSVESDETFNVTLSSASGGTTLPAGPGVVTIDDDDLPGLSIGDVTVAEGNAGITQAVFNVTLTGNNSQQNVTVEFTTTNGTAEGPGDFAVETGILTFAPGQTTQSITVDVVGDTAIEATENFTVTLSNPTTGTAIVDGSATGTITNDDLPAVTIGPDVSVTEGNNGTTNAVFTITLSAGSPTQVVVPFTINGVTATAGSDYTDPANLSATFAPNATQSLVTVQITGDMLNEANEIFNVNITPAPTLYTIADGQATGTITNDDPPAISIGDVTVTEGNSGTTNAVFNVTLSSVWTSDITVVATTSNGVTNPATAGSDYTATTVTVTIPAGQTSRPVTVPVLGDTLSEGNETFRVTLTGQNVGTLGDGEAIGTITDDDQPLVTVSDITLNEGNSGTTNAVFTVTLSASPTQQVTVQYTTAAIGGQATAGTDFTSANGTLTFTAGTTTLTQLVTVQVLGDTTVEPNETFNLNLTNATNAQISDGTGLGTITNDDLPSISISSPTVTEGNSGTTSAVVTVTLSAASSQQVLIPYDTSGGTATAGTDYTSASGTLTFAAGTTSQTVTIAVTGDTTAEVNETFNFNVTSPTGATAPANPGVVTITNDDGPAFTVNDVTVTEGNTGTTNAVFTVTLLGSVAQNTTVQFATGGGTATAGTDYVSSTGTLTFTAGGPTTQLVTVTVNGDTTAEANETFNLTLSNASGGALISDAQGVATINSDDQPTISIGDVTVAEGDSGTTNAIVTVTLNGASSQNVTVNFATASGSATSGVDFTAQNGALTFTPGTTTQVITIAIAGDALDEANETFNVNLSGASGATAPDSVGVVTITDNDPIPTLSIGDVTAAEGDAPSNMVFTVTLSAASGQTVTAAYSTANGTATFPFDYTTTSGTVTFAAGQTTQTITVAIRGDNTDEQNESFTVNLSSPTNVTLADGIGTGNITDDDLPGEAGASSLSGKVYLDINNSGSQDGSETPMSGVTIQLADAGGTNILRTTTTDAEGNYYFLDLQPGSYTIIQTQPATMQDGIETVGSQGGTSTTNDRIAVTLNESIDGTGNNFAERGLRGEFISKRVFLSSNTSTTTTLQALNLREGSVWMPFDAGIDGTLTAQASGAAGEGMPRMTIYDNNLRPLASSTGYGTEARLDYQGQPGQPYFLAISGANSDVDVELSNNVKQVGSVVTVSGTEANDTFEFSAGSSYSVIINGVNYTFSPANVSSIVFNGNGGSDTAIVNGSSAAETANLTLGSGTVSGSGYSVALNGVNNIVVNGNGGNDVATLIDSAFDDDLDAEGDWVGLSNDYGFATSLDGYRRVTANASQGGNDTTQIGAIDLVLERNGWDN